MIGGHVFTWGGNSHGQLGVGSTEAQIPYASHVKALSGYPVSQVAAGGCHTFALTFTGLVFGWGSNRSAVASIFRERNPFFDIR